MVVERWGFVFDISELLFNIDRRSNGNFVILAETVCCPTEACGNKLSRFMRYDSPPEAYETA